MEINGRFNLTECLFIQYEYTHGACERMVEYMHTQFNVCLHCKYLCVCAYSRSHYIQTSESKTFFCS